MDNGEISLRAELGKMENPEEIKKLAEDAEMSGYEDVAKMAQEKISEILAKTNTVEKTSESQISQVESMGGSAGEIEKRTEGIDKQIEDVKTEATGEIEKVKNEGANETEEKVTEVKNSDTQKEQKQELKEEKNVSQESKEDEALNNFSSLYLDSKGSESNWAFALEKMSKEEVQKVMEKFPYSVGDDLQKSLLYREIIKYNNNKFSSEELIELDKKINNKQGQGLNDEAICCNLLETGKIPFNYALEMIQRGGGGHMQRSFIDKSNFSNMSTEQVGQVLKVLSVDFRHAKEILQKSGKTKEEMKAYISPNAYSYI